VWRTGFSRIVVATFSQNRMPHTKMGKNKIVNLRKSFIRSKISLLKERKYSSGSEYDIC
jgi:hypothetical protein